MRRWFPVLVVAAVAMFVAAPFVVGTAPQESTMGLIQKIFYVHVPSWIAMYTAIGVCGVGSLVYIFSDRKAADSYAVAGAEVAVLFGLMGLVTGPLWGRKAWGVWWNWGDVRLVSALLLELIFVAYLLVRRYGGPGAEKLAAATALFGTATAPFVYKSVDIWRTVHPKTTVVPTLPSSLGAPLAFTSIAVVLLCLMLLTLRVNLARRQTALDDLYRAAED
jgi:heme exporter protein C